MAKIKATGGIKVSGQLRAKRFNTPPAWDTIAGSLGTPFESQAFSVTPGATDPDSFPSGGDVDYSITSGSLPAGLTLNTETGEISGTPTAVGSDTLSNFTLRAEDGPLGANLPGKSVERAFTITIIDDNPPNVSPAAGAIGSVAELTAAALIQITATDPNTVTQSISFSEVGANLTTENLSIDSNGNITGTPPDSGGTRTLNFTVRASTATNSTDVAYSISITDNQDPVWVTAAGLLATVNESEAITTITLAATDDNAVSYSVTSGALPGGLTLNSSNGEITGTPSNVAEDTTSDFEVTATDTVELDSTARCFQIKVLNVIANSLRFNDDDSAYLSKTPSASNRKTWTFSSWVKRGAIDHSNTITLFSASGATFDEGVDFTGGGANDILRLILDGNNGGFKQSAPLFRDPSAWYHVVAVLDTTQATGSDRIKLYANGVLLATSSSADPALNSDKQINSANSHAIGRQEIGTDNHFDGYMAETYFIDGLALTPTSFGAFDANGDWQPKEYSGAFGTNGFHLDYAVAPGTGNGGGTDVSGNANHWTDNGLAANDQVIDTPTNNFVTFNPLSDFVATSATYSDGNLTLTGQSVNALGSIAVTSGVFNWEVKVDTVGTSQDTRIGIRSVEVSITGGFGLSIVYEDNGNKVVDGSATASAGATYGAADVIDVVLDLDTGTPNVEFFKNGNSQFSVNIADSAGIGPWAPTVMINNNSTDGAVTLRSGAVEEFALPVGAEYLNTLNLPTPTIADPSDHFEAKLYTGNATASTDITGLDFQPDLVWIKNRSQADEHKLVDAVRGATKELNSDSINNESTDANGLTAFNADGFTLGTGANGYNDTGESFVSWCWNESATPGFDIVSYVGDGAAGHNISHSLGAIPDLMIVKGRDLASVKGWRVYHSANTSAPETDHLILNTTAATLDQLTTWNDTAPTSSVFTLGSESGVNADTKNYIAYLWAEVEGFSKFGSYTGNGSADGPFVWCGFRPAFLLIKETDVTGSWVIKDTARDPNNVSGRRLVPDTSVAELTSNTLTDILSNGFKLRDSAVNINTSSGTYVFAAFAESPFKTARAR